jgi:hypothetical protein
MTEPTDVTTLVLIKTSPEVRLWGGFGSLVTPSDDPLDPSAAYGSLVEDDNPKIGAVPAMRQLVGGTAEIVDFTFSGVEAVPKDWVDSGAALGCALHVGLRAADAYGSQIGDIWWIRKYIVATATASGGVDSAVVTLSVESACSYRARAGLRMFTDAFHKLLHATDNFFRRMLKNSVSNTPKWPGG